MYLKDINHSGDGGIYAELIRNRAFQSSPDFPATLDPWTPVGNTVLSLNNASNPLSAALPTSLHVTSGSNYSRSSHTLGFSNPGYWGIDVEAQTYTGSFYVTGEYDGFFTLALVSDTSNATLGQAHVVSESVAGAWIQHNFTITPTKAATDVNNSLSLTFSSRGLRYNASLDFNLISLFPPTYKNR
jgi:alpha-N-arabinofuranosidase